LSYIALLLLYFFRSMYIYPENQLFLVCLYLNPNKLMGYLIYETDFGLYRKKW